MTSNVSPIPQGFHTVTPHLMVSDGAAAIAFYKEAFGAEEIGRMPGPDGKGVMHASLRVGDSMLFLGDIAGPESTRSPKDLGGASSSLMLYVKDVDAAFSKAVAAGATVKAPLMNMFWGDRWGMVQDPFGHFWQLATHIEDVPQEEWPKRMAAAFSASKS